MQQSSFGWRHAGLALCCMALCFPAHAADALHPLWELHGKHNTVYLLGSIHVLRPGDYPLPQVILDAYAGASSLLMEIDLENIDSAQIRTDLLAAAALPPGKSLHGILGDKAYAHADALARGVGVELSTLDAYAPWFAAEAISEQQLAALGFQAESGVEMYFVERARNDGKSVAGLETVREQISLFQSMTLHAQADYLVSSLEQAHELGRQADAMVHAWQRGDAAWFASEIKQEFGRDPALYETMLTGRNRKWLPRIEALLNEDRNYLIIVGTGHLVGRGGVVDLLRKDGIKAIQR